MKIPVSLPVSLGLAVFVIILAIISAYLCSPKSSFVSGIYTGHEESNIYVRFEMDAYDSIAKNYWVESSKYNLPEIFRLSIKKVTGIEMTLPSNDRTGVSKILNQTFATSTTEEVKRQLATDILRVVTYNLQPNGRNQLLSAQQETALRQEVANINPSKDLYQDLGLAKGASTQAIEIAYKDKSAELKKSTASTSKAELITVNYAHRVLSDSISKALYDQSQIEPTVFRTVIGKTLYVYISRMSPTTLMEFARGVDAASTTPNLDSMILDFRGNIGGSLDFLQYFLGLYIGPNQYAFDLYHQGIKEPQRTVPGKFDELNRFSEIAILTDGLTQSTAELTTQTMKHFHLAKSVGATTRGWGTIENTYPIRTNIDPNTRYALELVNHLTLRDDDKPIEGNGVTPDVNTNLPSWKNQLSQEFHSLSLIQALKQTATSAPIK